MKMSLEEKMRFVKDLGRLIFIIDEASELSDIDFRHISGKESYDIQFLIKTLVHRLPEVRENYNELIDMIEVE